MHGLLPTTLMLGEVKGGEEKNITDECHSRLSSAIMKTFGRKRHLDYVSQYRST